MHQRVVILGASDKPYRYSYLALRSLVEHGHEVILVGRGRNQIEGRPVLPDLGGVTGGVDTLTVYVAPATSLALREAIIALKPKRVLFNPGAENATLASALSEAGIAHENACTLVLLKIGAF